MSTEHTDTATAALVDLLAAKLEPVVFRAVEAAARAALASKPAAPLMDVAEVAVRLNCGEETVRRAAKDGRLTAVTCLGHFRFRPSDVETWISGGDPDLEADPVRSFAKGGSK